IRQDFPDQNLHSPVFVPLEPLVYLMTEDEVGNLLGQRPHVQAGVLWHDLTEPALLATGGLLVHGQLPLLPRCPGPPPHRPPTVPPWRSMVKDKIGGCQATLSMRCSSL